MEAAIDEFFSQSYIVPSPWVGQSSAKHHSRLNDLMDCNGSPILNSSARNAESGQGLAAKGGARATDAATSAMIVGTSAVAGSSR